MRQRQFVCRSLLDCGMRRWRTSLECMPVKYINVWRKEDNWGSGFIDNTRVYYNLSQTCVIISSVLQWIIGFIGNTLLHTGAQCIRDITGCSTASFKEKLDGILAQYPDESRLQGHGKYSLYESNSLLDVKRTKTRIDTGITRFNGWRISESWSTARTNT